MDSKLNCMASPAERQVKLNHSRPGSLRTSIIYVLHFYAGRKRVFSYVSFNLPEMLKSTRPRGTRQ